MHREKRYESAWPVRVETSTAGPYTLFGGRKECGLGQGQETPAGRALKNQHARSKSSNLILQTLGVIEMQMRSLGFLF